MAQPTHKTFTLVQPIELEGRQAITEVKCKRPKWKHIKNLMKNVSADIEEGHDMRTPEERQADQAQDVDAIDELLRELSGLSEQEFDEMDMEDVLDMQSWLEVFIKKYQKTGETS